MKISDFSSGTQFMYFAALPMPDRLKKEGVTEVLITPSSIEWMQASPQNEGETWVRSGGVTLSVAGTPDDVVNHITRQWKKICDGMRGDGNGPE